MTDNPADDRPRTPSKNPDARVGEPDATPSRNVAANPTPDDPSTATRRVLLDAAFRNRTAVRQGLTENLKTARLENDQVTARVDKAFEHFNASSLPAADPKRRNHVERGVDPLGALQHVMKGRLDTLRGAPPAAALAIRRESRLLDRDAAGDTRDRTDEAAAPDGRADTATKQIELKRLIDFTPLWQSGPISRRTPAAESICKAEAEAQKVLDSIEGSAKVQSQERPLPVEGSASVEAADTLVGRTVTLQMRSATSPEDRLTYGLIPNAADANEVQKAILETFQLRPSPSDTTSYHDFNVLQIAFEHVWTELFDGELESLGKQLYKEYVGLKDFLGYDPATADTPISSLDDLKWLIAEIRSLSQFAQDAIPAGTGGGARTPGGGGAKGANDLAKDAEDFIENLPGGRVGTAIGTAGLSELFLLALNELGKAGQKPVLTWAVFDGNGTTLNRGDRIVATIEQGIVGSGKVGFRLLTDVGSHKKLVTFQRFDEASGKFVNDVVVSNVDKRIIQWQGRDHWGESATFSAAQLATGAMEFSTQETETINLGRYVLTHLNEPNRLTERAQVTFYWTDN